MRILVTTDSWGLIGGSERYAGQVVEALAARGHALRVLCGARRTPSLALPDGVELVVDENYSDAGASPRELSALVHGARAFAPEVVLALACFQARTFAALARIGPLVRFVQDHTLFCPSLNKIVADGGNCHRPLGSICLERYFLADGCSCFHQSGRVKPWIEGVGEFKKKLFEFDAAKRARALVVASRYMRDELVQAGDAPEHVRVIPYFTRSASAAIPAAPLSKLTERFLASGNEPLVLTPARLALPDKGLDVLLEALARTRVPLRALIAGDGPARAWLESKAQAEGLGARVHFAGWQTAGQIESLYARAQVVAFPSTWKEPFGLVGLEAMAHGKPVVAFDVGGVPEWLEHGRNGFLLPRGDAGAFAQALERLAGDLPLCLRLGEAGRARLASEFSEAAHLEQLEQVLARAAGVELAAT